MKAVLRDVVCMTLMTQTFQLFFSFSLSFIKIIKHCINKLSMISPPPALPKEKLKQHLDSCPPSSCPVCQCVCARARARVRECVCVWCRFLPVFVVPSHLDLFIFIMILVCRRGVCLCVPQTGATDNCHFKLNLCRNYICQYIYVVVSIYAVDNQIYVLFIDNQP